MPGYRVHVMGGLAAAGVTILLVLPLAALSPSVPEMVLVVLTAVLFAMIPDIDTDSKAQNIIYGVLIVLDLALIIQRQFQTAAILGFAALLPAAGRHRGWTHTWWAMLLMPAPLIILPYLLHPGLWRLFLPYYLAGLIGYASHLILDRAF